MKWWAAFLFCTIHLQAQPTRLSERGVWGMYFGQTKIDAKWAIHHEAQYRSHKISPNHEQILLRGGLVRNFNPQTNAILGYAYVVNYPLDSPIDAPSTTEHRIWQQLLLRQKWGKVNFEHRYRFEQRWIENQDMSLRSRYRIALSTPIRDSKFLASAYNEVFLKNNPVSFDRNRLYGAVGYQIDAQKRIEVGAMRQVTSSTSKLYAQIAFFQTINRK